MASDIRHQGPGYWCSLESRKASFDLSRPGDLAMVGSRSTASTPTSAMRMLALRSSLLIVLLETAVFLPCHAFGSAAPDSMHPRSRVGRITPTNQAFYPRTNRGEIAWAANRIPHGGNSTALLASLQDYSEAARTLFGNLIGPASMIAGGMVPLGFLAPPLPGKTKNDRRLRSLYFMISVLSLANELMAIIYATVAANKLTETVVAPTASVFALLQRDYELPWVATNVHFIYGLLGFITMIAIRAYTLSPTIIGRACAGIAASFLLGMFSIVNRGIAEGNREGRIFGTSILTLTLRYMTLLFRQIRTSGGSMAVVAMILGCSSFAMALTAIVEADE